MSGKLTKFAANIKGIKSVDMLSNKKFVFGKYEHISLSILNETNIAINAACESIQNVSMSVEKIQSDGREVSVSQYNTMKEEIMKNKSIIQEEFYKELAYYCVLFNNNQIDPRIKGIHANIQKKQEEYDREIKNCVMLLSNQNINFYDDERQM